MLALSKIVCQAHTKNILKSNHPVVTTSTTDVADTKIYDTWHSTIIPITK